MSTRDHDATGAPVPEPTAPAASDADAMGGSRRDVPRGMDPLSIASAAFDHPEEAVEETASRFLRRRRRQDKRAALSTEGTDAPTPDLTNRISGRRPRHAGPASYDGLDPLEVMRDALPKNQDAPAAGRAAPPTPEVPETPEVDLTVTTWASEFPTVTVQREDPATVDPAPAASAPAGPTAEAGDAGGWSAPEDSSPTDPPTDPVEEQPMDATSDPSSESTAVSTSEPVEDDGSRSLSRRVRQARRLAAAAEADQTAREERAGLSAAVSRIDLYIGSRGASATESSTPPEPATGLAAETDSSIQGELDLEVPESNQVTETAASEWAPDSVDALEPVAAVDPEPILTKGEAEATSAADEGWVYHDADGADTSVGGWLYHYADGTMVDEDGTVYEYPSESEPNAEPNAEPDTEPVTWEQVETGKVEEPNALAVEPDVTEPADAATEVVEPEVVEPEAVEPEVVEPEIADLSVAETTGPEVTEPVEPDEVDEAVDSAVSEPMDIATADVEPDPIEDSKAVAAIPETTAVETKVAEDRAPEANEPEAVEREPEPEPEIAAELSVAETTGPEVAETEAIDSAAPEAEIGEGTDPEAIEWVEPQDTDLAEPDAIEPDLLELDAAAELTQLEVTEAAAVPVEEASAPGTAPWAPPTQAPGSSWSAPSASAEPSPAPDAAEVLPEPEPQPVAAIEPAIEPGARPTAAARSAAPRKVPAYVEYRPSIDWGTLLSIAFMVACVAAVISVFIAIQQPGTIRLTAGGLIVLAVGFGWAMVNWAPPIVSVDRGILEVSRGKELRTFDLRDPDLEVSMGDPDQGKWQAVFRQPGGQPVTVPAPYVVPRQFVEIVEYYRAQAGTIQDEDA